MMQLLFDLRFWWPGIALGAVLAAYSAYWGAILLYGALKVLADRDAADPPDPPDLPFISILIPARDEASVVGRTVEALDAIRYPRDRMEVIFAEDGSIDGTYEVLRGLASTRPWMKVYHFEGAGSKAAALNRALGLSRGELIYFLDADAVPDPDALLRLAAMYRAGARAIVGRYAVANPHESAVSRMILIEELAWRFMCEGRSRLRMMCPPPAGSNYAIDRKLLVEIGGFREGSLAEDAVMASALVAVGVRPAYSGVTAMVSVPTRLGALFRQRVRWYRGYLEAFVESLRGLRRSSDRRGTLDAALLFSSPVFAALGLVNIAIDAWIPSWAALLLVGSAAATVALWAYMRRLGGYYARESGVALMLVPYVLMISAFSAAAAILHALRARKTWHRDHHSPGLDPARIAGRAL
ncbi:MAG: glycosyltransferase family 2 protein [Nitrososphaeria archaeon]